MISNYQFIKKNDQEIFKKLCYDAGQQLDFQMERLCEIRRIIYDCVNKKPKPIIDSNFKEDVNMIQKHIALFQEAEQKQIFQKTIVTLNSYKTQFEQMNFLINTKLKQSSQNQARSFSTNRKLYENVINKREILYNFFYSVQDSDSPCKVRSEVFLF